MFSLRLISDFALPCNGDIIISISTNDLSFSLMAISSFGSQPLDFMCLVRKFVKKNLLFTYWSWCLTFKDKHCIDMSYYLHSTSTAYAIYTYVLCSTYRNEWILLILQYFFDNSRTKKERSMAENFSISIISQNRFEPYDDDGRPRRTGTYI